MVRVPTVAVLIVLAGCATAPVEDVREPLTPEERWEPRRRAALEAALSAVDRAVGQPRPPRPAEASEHAMYRAPPLVLVPVATCGEVTAVDEEANIVLLDVGSDDMVPLGLEVPVFRGRSYLGRLVVDRIGPDWAACHMVPELTREFPRRGDLVELYTAFSRR
jgi:hypothetical protein